jgi:hypothetical protein
MSDFKDNFKRGSEEESTLNYDDSAFFYFSIAILTVIVVPWTLSLLNQMIWGEKNIEISGKNCQCKKCQAIFNERSAFYRRTWMRPGFYMKIAFVAALWVLWYLVAE